jgi:hypothetical protein
VPIIGREYPADIVVPAPQVSSRHAEIRHLDGERYELIDLNSLNGTFVSDRRISSAVISLDDPVRLGSIWVNLRPFAYLIPRKPPSPSPHPQFEQRPPHIPDDGRYHQAPLGRQAASMAPSRGNGPPAAAPTLTAGASGPPACPACGSHLRARRDRHLRSRGGIRRLHRHRCYRGCCSESGTEGIRPQVDLPALRKEVLMRQSPMFPARILSLRKAPGGPRT